MNNAPAVKRCLNCGRDVFSMYRGDITVKPPARGERFEANGNVVAICKCGRRVIWYRSKREHAATITTG